MSEQLGGWLWTCLTYNKCPQGRNTTPTSSAMQILHSTFFSRRSSDGNFDWSTMLVNVWSSGTAVAEVDGTFVLPMLDDACSLSSLCRPTDETAESKSCVTWLSRSRLDSALSNPSSSIWPSSTAETSASVLVKGRPVNWIFRCIIARTRPALSPIESASIAAWVLIASSIDIVGVTGIDWFPESVLLMSFERWMTPLMYVEPLTSITYGHFGNHLKRHKTLVKYLRESLEVAPKSPRVLEPGVVVLQPIPQAPVTVKTSDL